jgi:hypothetical protein
MERASCVGRIFFIVGNSWDDMDWNGFGTAIALLLSSIPKWSDDRYSAMHARPYVK